MSDSLETIIVPQEIAMIDGRILEQLVVVVFGPCGTLIRRRVPRYDQQARRRHTTHHGGYYSLADGTRRASNPNAPLAFLLADVTSRSTTTMEVVMMTGAYNLRHWSTTIIVATKRIDEIGFKIPTHFRDGHEPDTKWHYCSHS